MVNVGHGDKSNRNSEDAERVTPCDEWRVKPESLHEACRHCGTPVPAGRTDGFCCTGCGFVNRMLHEQGLDRFYQLKGQLNLAPVAPEALRPRDYVWLEQMVREAEESLNGDGDVELCLSLQGLSCVGCVWLIERLFERHAGGRHLRVDITRAELRVQARAGEFGWRAFAEELQSFGYLVGPPTRGDEGAREVSGLERRMGVCGAFAMNAMAFSLPRYFGMPREFAFATWFEIIAAASATLAMLAGGTYFIERAWRSLKVGMLHIDTPIALGVTAAYAGSLGGWVIGEEGLFYFDFVAVFIFLMLVGRWAQQAAVERNRRKLMRDTSIPDWVRLADQGQLIPVSEVKEGTRFVLGAAQTLPVAARLEASEASVSLEWINGETAIQTRSCGQLLSAGALNVGFEDLEVTAMESWDTSALRRLLESKKHVEYRDLRLESLLRVYLMVVVAGGLLGGIGWLLAGQPVAKALQVMISIFVVSCPCALGVAVPLAEELASSRAERLGVFVRKLTFWKRLLRVRRVVFDKTGTLTYENPQLLDLDSLAQLNEEARSALRRLVTGNLHPVSRSLFDAIGPGPMAKGEVEERIGHGLAMTDESGIPWSLTRPKTAGEGTHADAVDVILERNGVRIVGFGFQDALRADSSVELSALRGAGLSVHILSGDRSEKVAAIASRLGLADGDWNAGMTPEEKGTWIGANQPEETLYIGDGANDSLAFDRALCTGSPIGGRSFLEQKSDFFFLGNSLRFLMRLREVAAQHRRALRGVFTFSVIYNIVTAGMGLAGRLDPLAAAILMPSSSVVTLAIVAWVFAQKPLHSDRSGLVVRPDIVPSSQE